MQEDGVQRRGIRIIYNIRKIKHENLEKEIGRQIWLKNEEERKEKKIRPKYETCGLCSR